MSPKTEVVHSPHCTNLTEKSPSPRNYSLISEDHVYVLMQLTNFSVRGETPFLSILLQYQIILEICNTMAGLRSVRKMSQG